MTKLKPFGERVKELREGRGWSQEELSENMRISADVISELEESTETPIPRGMHLVLANIFEKPVLEVVEGTPEEEIILNHHLGPRFCSNHESIVVPRQENGFENKFCSECGEKLGGDCEHCGAPISWNWSLYCGVCGNEITSMDKERGEALYWERFEMLESEHWEFDNAAQYAFRYPIGICPSTQKHIDERDGLYRVLHIRPIRSILATDNSPGTTDRGSSLTSSSYLFFPHFFQTLRYHFNGRIDYCTICGQKKYTHCPQCNRPLIGLSSLSLFMFCPGCGFKFCEIPQTPVRDAARRLEHTWKRISDNSRDLRLANPEQFNQGMYAQLVREFISAAKRMNSGLQQNLIQLQSDLTNAILKGDGDKRAGYLGLNRWCFTQSRRDQKGVEPAQRLWSFLFGEEEPTRLAELANGKTGMIEVSEDVWSKWYEKISKQQQSSTLEVNE